MIAAVRSMTASGGDTDGAGGPSTASAATIQHFGPSSGGNRRRDRWLVQMADEIAHLAGRGATGTRRGLLEHLRFKFGDVGEQDLVIAMDSLPAHCTGRFK